LKITVVDVDDDYLGITVAASSGRFSGTAYIYAGLHELSALAACIAGFPAGSDDARHFEFGSRDSRIAGGFADLRLHCLDGAGHAQLAISFEDDTQFHRPASSSFTFPIAAADIDRFVRQLHSIENARAGDAVLPSAG